MDSYLLNRPNLITTFILIDSRIEPQKSDLQLMEWMGEHALPFVIVFTKSDKLGAVNLEKSVNTYKKQLLLQWEELPPVIVTSSELRKGKEEILDYIDSNNQHFDPYSNSIRT